MTRYSEMIPFDGDGCFHFDENGEIGISFHVYPNGHIQLGIGHDVSAIGPEYVKAEEGHQRQYLLMARLDGDTLRIASLEEQK